MLFRSQLAVGGGGRDAIGRRLDVLAMAVYPKYDPNQAKKSSMESRRNRAITDLFEPGSVFKVFSLSTLLDSGLLLPGDTFLANGAYEHTVASTGEVIRVTSAVNANRIYTLSNTSAVTGDTITAKNHQFLLKQKTFKEG